MGGKFHLKLNIGERPIANKYREGKMKRTLKRELKVPEIAEREALAISDTCLRFLGIPGWSLLVVTARGTGKVTVREA
jgi:hypothetical protein